MLNEMLPLVRMNSDSPLRLLGRLRQPSIEYFTMAFWMALLCILTGCGTREVTSLPIQKPSERQFEKPTKAKAVQPSAGVKVAREDDLPGYQEVRPPAVAGIWYPKDADELKQTVDECLRSAKAQRKDKVPVGLIVPHAGWKFCGHVAAEAYKLIQGQEFDTVIVVGPSHYFPVQGAAVSTAKSFLTPLGRIEVDLELASRLVERCRLVYRNSLAHDREHCIETQLPFLQVALSGKWKLLPITTGEMKLDHCKELGRAIAGVVAGRKALLIASTDMSHYPKYEDANRADKEMINELKTLSSEKIWQTNDRLLKSRIRNLECTLCGMSAVLTVIEAVKLLYESPYLDVLAYANSGDVPGGDKSKVVGYVAACIYGKQTGSAKAVFGRARQLTMHEAHIRPQLSDAACKELIEIVKLALRSAVREGRAPQVKVNSRELFEPWGVFVTLKENDKLRGCVGIVEPVKPLWMAAIDAAVSAALHDSRFPPVAPDEVEKLTVEVTVLGRLEEIISLKEIEIGRHGLVVIDGEHSGLLLPQVAAEFKWDRVKFVEATCEKAGISKDAWKEGAFVLRFDAQVIE